VSTFNGLIDLLSNTEDTSNDNTIIKNERANPFDLQLFCDELKTKSEEENKLYLEYAESISGYSIASECIGTSVFKILNYPVESFSHKWLPIIMRASIGKAVHETIQNNTNQFTEQERSMKVPSIRVSVRLDGLIGNNVLVEIKSCTYDDYNKILKTQKPRIGDFYQCMLYKYIIENHLEECKLQTNTRTAPPSLDKYDIDTLQFIYVAHDIISSDSECISECLKTVKTVKKLLNSKSNKFFFMTSVVLNTKDFEVKPFFDYIKEKIDSINYYVNSNKIPESDNKFIDRSKCFFCLYSPNCPIK
jgi:hypothetical protein